MNRKEISEIRRQLSPEKSTISRLCCCYVNHEKEKIMEHHGSLLTLPEEEQFKYFDLFRASLSGTPGRNLMNLEYARDSEQPGGSWDFLMQLRETGLRDEMLVSDFFDRIIANYTFGENYLILLVTGSYDIPGRTSDRRELFDASEEVYTFLLCSICPVNLTKPGLSYLPEKNELGARIRDWLVEKPMHGFLFPAFNDRAADIHQLLYYSSKPEEIQSDFIDIALGAPVPMTSGVQRDVFRDLAAEALADNCDFEAARSIRQNLDEMIEQASGDPAPLELSGQDVLRLLEQSGIPEENLSDFDESFSRIAGSRAVLTASNLSEKRSFRVESPHVTVKVDPEYADLLETRIIDGRPCLIIPVENRIEVNGIPVRAALEEQE